LQLSKAQKKLFGKETIPDIYPEIYLIKVNQFDDIAKDSLDEWIYFFKNSEIKSSFKAKGLKEANEKLMVANLPEEERKTYNRYLNNLHYRASLALTWKIQAEESAEKIYKTKIAQVAKQMKDENEPIDKIMRFTGLSREEIEAL